MFVGHFFVAFLLASVFAYWRDVERRDAFFWVFLPAALLFFLI